jgi:hypothetical protein
MIMKRLRPRCFKEILKREETSGILRVDYVKIERLRRLVWCYNKYIFPITTPELLFRLAKYHNLIKFARPGVWLPEIRTK